MNMSILHRSLFFAVAVLLITAHRLPAPVSELETPKPAPQQPARPKHAKANITGDSPASKMGAMPSATPHKKFAGTWTGTMETFPAGAQTTMIAIDASETTMSVNWF